MHPSQLITICVQHNALELGEEYLCAVALELVLIV